MFRKATALAFLFEFDQSNEMFKHMNTQARLIYIEKLEMIECLKEQT